MELSELSELSEPLVNKVCLYLSSNTNNIVKAYIKNLCSQRPLFTFLKYRYMRNKKVSNDYNKYWEPYIYNYNLLYNDLNDYDQDNNVYNSFQVIKKYLNNLEFDLLECESLITFLNKRSFDLEKSGAKQLAFDFSSLRN